MTGPRIRIPKENKRERSERAVRISDRLAEAYPDAECALVHRNPWELLIATILSAQCTDATVNQVTPALFEECPDPAALARAPQRKIEKLIRRTGFFSQKAKSIRECAQSVEAQFGGEVPRDMDSLVSLRGVGRKTASVVLGTAFNEPAVFVDTHVRRLSRRLGLTRNVDPDKIQDELKTLLPPEHWTMFCHRMIHHGRRICQARKPACEICPVQDLCPRIGVAMDTKTSSPKPVAPRETKR